VAPFLYLVVAKTDTLPENTKGSSLHFLEKKTTSLLVELIEIPKKSLYDIVCLRKLFTLNSR